MERMLVTQALNELKTLDARIMRAINNANFVASAKTCENNVSPYKTKENFISEAKASMSSITDLINRRETIKSAVVESNANTMVEVCGIKMSVAKAIDTKNSMTYHKSLLNVMKAQLANAQSTATKNNAAMETKVDNLVATAFGKESKTKISPEDYDGIAKPFRASNEYSLVDPLNIEKLINEKENFIDDFYATVDQILQVSNCTTFIEI